MTALEKRVAALVLMATDHAASPEEARTAAILALKLALQHALRIDVSNRLVSAEPVPRTSERHPVGTCTREQYVVWGEAGYAASCSACRKVIHKGDDVLHVLNVGYECESCAVAMQIASAAE